METNIEYEYTFYGYQCFEWINEYSTVLSPEEALMVASEFILYGWIQQVTLKNEIVNNSDDNTVTFRYGKKTIYYLTQRGRAAIGLSNGNDAASIYGQSQMGNFSERSSTHSSASGSSTTIQSTTKAPSIKTQKQNHAKRLLPTTSSTEKSTVPKATVTEKTDVPTPTNEKSKSSLINMDSRCDFGFRPPLNKDSTSDAVVAKNNNNKANDIVAEEEYDDEHITEELLQLKISEKLNSKVPGSNTSQISSVASTITSLDDQDSSSSVSNETDTDEINKNLHFISQNIPQSAKLQAILEDPLLRMYFRQYLRTNYCEENINFWTDYRVLRKKIALETSEITEELCNSLLFECGVIYYNYLCEESSPVELNIDHTLRLEISYFMKALFAAMGPKNISHSMNNLPGQINEDMPFGSISASPSVVPIIDLVSSTMHKHHPGLLKNSKLNPYKCLKKSLYLFDKVNNHVIRMMAQDSIPRFIKSEKYQELLELHTGNKEQNNIICPTSLQRAKPPKSSNHLND
jgi:hypothetical protein